MLALSSLVSPGFVMSHSLLYCTPHYGLAQCVHFSRTIFISNPFMARQHKQRHAILASQPSCYQVLAWSRTQGHAIFSSMLRGPLLSVTQLQSRAFASSL